LDIRHEWRTVNGVRLHYTIAGNGPLLLLLHGFPEFWYSWRHQIPILAEYFTVVAPDMRGYNDSDKPPRIDDYSLPKLVEDIVQLIHSFGQSRALVAGHDWGGVVAWATALARPDVVEKLIILNAPHPRLFMQHILTNPLQCLRSWYILFFQLPWLPEKSFRANNYRMIEEVFRGMSVHKRHFSNEVIARYKQALAKPGALTSAINYYRALTCNMSTRFTVNLDPVVAMPTLVIWGEQDTALGKELNNHLERYVPNLTLHFIPDASHWVHQNHPDLINQYILAFVML
jgi:pimeloyl-ACP methyl ester carboxylesterase